MCQRKRRDEGLPVDPQWICKHCKGVGLHYTIDCPQRPQTRQNPNGQNTYAQSQDRQLGNLNTNGGNTQQRHQYGQLLPRQPPQNTPQNQAQSPWCDTCKAAHAWYTCQNAIQNGIDAIRNNNSTASNSEN